jgi:hypothetical protein
MLMPVLVLALGQAAQPKGPGLPASFNGAVTVKLATGYHVECSIDHDAPPAGTLDFLVVDGPNAAGASIQVLRETPRPELVVAQAREQQIKQGDQCGQPRFSKRVGRRKIVGRVDCLDQLVERTIDTSVYLLDLPQFPSGIAVVTIWSRRGDHKRKERLLADVLRSLTIVAYRPGVHGGAGP